jgi:RHS repeat-associated protein
VTNPFTFAGREYDAKSGLYYYRSRYYDPAIGRFLSVDTIDAINPYIYADNSPTNKVDPNGTNAVEYFALINALTPVFVGEGSALGSVIQCLGIHLLPLNAALSGMPGSVANFEGNGGYHALSGLKNFNSEIALVADAATADHEGAGLSVGDLGSQLLGESTTNRIDQAPDPAEPVNRTFEKVSTDVASGFQTAAKVLNAGIGMYNAYRYLKSVSDLSKGRGDCV